MKKKLFTLGMAMMLAVACLLTPAGAKAANNEKTLIMGNTHTGNLVSDSGQWGDADVYRFTLATSGRITVSTKTTTAEQGMNFALLNQNDEKLTEFACSTTSSNGMGKETREYDLIAGNYYISVGKYSYWDNGGDYQMTVTFDSAKETFGESFASNDNAFQIANSIVVNKEYIGQIAMNDGGDWYKVTLPSSGIVTIDAVAKIPTVNYYLKEESTGWQESMTWVRKDNLSGQSNFTKDLYLSQGTYYFFVEKNEGTGNYKFNLKFTSANETIAEPATSDNNTMPNADAIELKKDYTGFLAHNDDTDFYKFSWTHTERVTVKITSPMKYYRYVLYNSKGEKISWVDWPSWDGVKSLGTVINEVELTPDTYYLAVSKDSWVGSYTLNVSPHVHEYMEEVTQATLDKDGQIVKKCECGSVNSTVKISRPKKMILSKTSYVYNGKTQKMPKVTVKDAKGKVIPASNYTVSKVTGRKNVGNYDVKVTFDGKKYMGTMTKTFSINPKGTSISKLKAVKKGFTIRVKKNTKQTTGYQVQYSLKKNFKGAKTYTMYGNKTLSATVKGLKANRKYYVRVRTYKSALWSPTNYSAWSKAKTVKTKR